MRVLVINQLFINENYNTMLIYINYENSLGDRNQESIKLESIKQVSEVSSQDGKNHCFQLETSSKTFKSRSYPSKEEAEMAQMSTISQLNALELMYERAKHVPEDRNSPVFFQVVDPAQKKLVPGKVTLYEQPVYTITI